MNKVKCKECNDTKSYTVKNAYDPTFEKKVPCEYCFEEGGRTRFIRG